MDLKKRWSILIYICAALGWWGLFFPEFTFTPDTYEIIYDVDHLANQEKKVVIDSKLLSVLAQYFKEDSSR